MVCSVSEQDKPNPALGLATRVDKLELSCRLGITPNKLLSIKDLLYGKRILLSCGTQRLRPTRK